VPVNWVDCALIEPKANNIEAMRITETRTAKDFDVSEEERFIEFIIFFKFFSPLQLLSKKTKRNFANFPQLVKSLYNVLYKFNSNIGDHPNKIGNFLIQKIKIMEKMGKNPKI
jgi:hypothetical protein